MLRTLRTAALVTPSSVTQARRAVPCQRKLRLPSGCTWSGAPSRPPPSRPLVMQTPAARLPPRLAHIRAPPRWPKVQDHGSAGSDLRQRTPLGRCSFRCGYKGCMQAWAEPQAAAGSAGLTADGLHGSTGGSPAWVGHRALPECGQRSWCIVQVLPVASDPMHAKAHRAGPLRC